MNSAATEGRRDVDDERVAQASGRSRPACRSRPPWSAHRGRTRCSRSGSAGARSGCARARRTRHRSGCPRRRAGAARRPPESRRSRRSPAPRATCPRTARGRPSSDMVSPLAAMRSCCCRQLRHQLARGLRDPEPAHELGGHQERVDDPVGAERRRAQAARQHDGHHIGAQHQEQLRREVEHGALAPAAGPFPARRRPPPPGLHGSHSWPGLSRPHRPRPMSSGHTLQTRKPL